MEDWAYTVVLDKLYRMLLKAQFMDCISLDRLLFPAYDNAVFNISALFCQITFSGEAETQQSWQQIPDG